MKYLLDIVVKSMEYSKIKIVYSAIRNLPNVDIFLLKRLK
jgi:hypothetical protein